MNRLRRFMINGMIMAGVSVLMRSVALGFNVYVSNRIGAEAMGLFSLISTVYGFAVTLATSGINLASTRLVAQVIGDERGAETDMKRRGGEARCVMRQCLAYAALFGGLASALLLVLAEDIGARILHDTRTVPSLRVLAMTLVPVSLSSALCGYFSALRKVSKNALTQILGQALKIFTSVFLFSALGASDTESACLCVVIGGAAAEIFSFLLALAFYLLEKRKGRVRQDAQKRRDTLRRLLSNALPLAFSAYMRSALVTVEHVLIPRGLNKSGSTHGESLAAYGTVGSMVFPLVLFPSAVSASFAGLLIPEVAGSHEAGDERRICGIISSVLHAVLAFSIGVAGVMMSFSGELGETVYPEARDAGRYILMISPLIPVMYLDTAVDAMLKGLGEQVYSMGVNIVDASCSVVLVLLLLPRLGIEGYIVTVYFTELLNGALSIARLLVKSRVKTHVVSWVARPLLAVITATRLTRTLFGGVGVWLSLLISSGAYVIILTLLGGIKPKRVLKSLRYMALQK